MDVALIIERIEPWRGGAETSTMLFAHHLARDGCRVSVVTTSTMPSTPDLTIVPIRASRFFRSARAVLFAKRAAAYVRAHDFDIVHCITPCIAADIYQPRGGTVPEMLERNATIRTSSLGRTFKRINQSLNIKLRMQAGMEAQLLQRQPAPWVIAISDYVSQQLQKHYHCEPHRIVRVFNGVDPDLSTEQERQHDRTQVRRQFHLSPDDLVVLCVAHNFKLKGVAKLIEALAQPAACRYHALIVGRDNPSAYATLAERLGVRDRVIFVGATTRIAAFFHAADVLAHPTYYDPCSRVVLEALASSLPTITTKFNGAAERVRDGIQGYVIDTPEDVEALADRLGRLANDEHRTACAANAPAAVADCSMEEHARSVRSLYNEILRQRQLAGVNRS